MTGVNACSYTITLFHIFSTIILPVFISTYRYTYFRFNQRIGGEIHCAINENPYSNIFKNGFETV